MEFNLCLNFKRNFRKIKKEYIALFYIGVKHLRLVADLGIGVTRSVKKKKKFSLCIIYIFYNTVNTIKKQIIP
jgi:hypothetical protein